MDFLDPKKKRAHLIKLYFGYALVSIALALGTTILVLAAYGYDIDRSTGNVIQNGLLIVDAHPEPARIIIDGTDRGGTNNRLVLPAGKYSLELQRKNYRTWSHSISLEGSSIDQIVYPFLFPEKMVTKSISELSALPSMASESPDRHWIIVHLPNTVSDFEVIDLNSIKNPKTAISLPVDTFTPAVGVHSYEAIEWSNDNTHLLLKHVFSNGSEYVILDRTNPANSLNLNKIFAKQPFTSVTLRDKKYDKFYLLNSATGGLYQADSGTLQTNLILPNVLSYKSYLDNTILYVTVPSVDSAVANVHIRQDEKDFLLRTVPKADKYLLEMAKFDNKFYIVCGSPSDGSVFIYKDPFESLNSKPSKTSQPFRVLIVPGAQYLSFSSIARFISVQGAGNFAVYDLEENKQFRYDINLPLIDNQEAKWMDGHRLSLVSNNDVYVFDFDGKNQQKLSASLPNFRPFFDRDFTAMFTLVQNKEKVNISRTELKVLPQL